MWGIAGVWLFDTMQSIQRSKKRSQVTICVSSQSIQSLVSNIRQLQTIILQTPLWVHTMRWELLFTQFLGLLFFLHGAVSAKSCTLTTLFISVLCSSNRGHPLQDLRGQVVRDPLWSHHLRRLQGEQLNTGKASLSAVPPSIRPRLTLWRVLSPGAGLLPPQPAEQRHVLVFPPEELPDWPDQPQSMPALPLAKVSGSGHEQRW